MQGLTFEQDCLIGARSFLDTWVCKHPLPFLVGLAYEGILLQVTILVAFIFLFVSYIIYRKVFKIR